MGLWDIDPLTGRRIKSGSEKTRQALTASMKTRIKEAVGYECEVAGCRTKPYDVHHIVPVSNDGINVGSNLVALCANHHRDAHNGALTQAAMKKIVAKRSKKVKQEITNILKGRRKEGENKGGRTPDPLDPFGFTKKRGKKKKINIWGL